MSVSDFKPVAAALSVSMRSRFSRLFRRKPAARLERAEQVYAQGRHAEAAVLLRELAEDGIAQAQLRLAQLLERGDGVLQNVVEAERWYRLAAEQNLVAAQARLGEIYLTGMASPELAAGASIERIADPNSGGSLFQRLYPQGLAIAQDLARAADWNLRAARAGDAGAQARFGQQCASGLGLKRNLLAAEHWFHAATEQGSLAGQLGLGMLYAGAYGERREHASAIGWLERCVAQGNSTAQLCLGLLLLYGEGVTHDQPRALALLEDAAIAGQPAAMFHLGELYRRGRFVELDVSEADTWLRRAAARGYPKAWLSLVHLFRAGPEPDLDTAAVMCRHGADLGDGEAQYLLGQMYLAGEGVPRDATEAARWLAKAADRNITAEFERRGAMPAEELAQATAAAAQYAS